MKNRQLCAVSYLVTVMIAGPACAQGLFTLPEPSSLHFVQYGVGLATESLLSPGSVCPASADTPCILGPGLGIALRLGYRMHGPFYIGGAYEATRHDSANILRLGILQQLRSEGRLLFDHGTRLSPYGQGSLGVAAYGNEWGADTVGPSVGLGAGLEYQASASAVVGLAVTWRGLALCSWTDGAGQQRANGFWGFGLSQWLGIELTLEIRSLLPRW